MKKFFVSIASLSLLIVAYLLLRYPLFHLHGMKQWPFYLFIIGFIVIVVSGFGCKCKRLPILTVAGYILGFIVGYIVRFDYGIGLNILWIIWTCLFVTFVLPVLQ